MRGVRTGKLFTVDRFATSAISSGKVASLEHELRDDTVEGRSFVSESVLASSELTEVACGLGDFIVVEFEDDAALRLAVDGDIELRRWIQTSVDESGVFPANHR